MIKKVRASVIGIAAMAVVLAAVLVAGGVILTGREQNAMPTDGYVLGVSQEEDGASVYQQNFAAGTVIGKKFPSSYAYQDVEGDKTVVADDSFIHFGDGSISAFADGVVVDAATVNDSVVEFYSLKSQMVMTAENGGYSIDNNSSTMEFGELLWMLNDKKYLAASSAMNLYLANGEHHSISGYLEITFLDEGIVQLANESDVWTSLASNTSIEFASGAILDLKDGVVYNKDHEACITLSSMAADMNSAVQINSDSNSNWVPPTFKVTAENGKDGTDGEAGTDGEQGDDGQEGEEGTKGQEGKAGETGATGGTPGTTSGGKDDENKSSTMGTIRVTNMTYTASAASFYLNVSDEDNTLTSNSGEIEVRNAETNQLVWSYTSAYSAEALDINKVNSASVFNITSGLNPDTEYILIVKNGYSMQTASGTTKGTKTFVNRHFFTSTEGVTMEKAENIPVTATEGGIKVTLNKQSYSKARSAMVRLEIGGKEHEIEVALSGNSTEVEFHFAELLSGGGEISAYTNQPYTLTLFTSESAQGSGAYNTNPETGEFQGDVQRSAYQIQGTTLKAEVELGDFEVTNSNQGYYTLEQKVRSDKDSSIVKYTFIIEKQEADGSVVTEKLESTTGIASWYYKENGSYKITSMVTYDDNEKQVEITGGVQNIALTVEGTAVLSFEPYTLRQDGNMYYAQNSKGELVDTVYNIAGHENNGFSKNELFDESRAWGDLIINTNGLKLEGNSELTIVVTGDQNNYKHTMERSVAEYQKNGEIRIPIQLAGLAQNGIYTITVSGTVLRNANIGGTSSGIPTVETLGRCFYRTKKYSYPEAQNQSAAVFQLVSANDGTNVAIAKWPSTTLYAEKYVNMNKDSKYYRARAAAAAVEFTVYSSLGKEIGSFAKSLYDATGYQPGTYVNDSTGAGQDYKAFLNGPLESSAADAWTDSSQIVITKDDLKSAGVLQVDSGEIQIKATALYDYGWYLSQNEAGYIQNYEGGGSYYNRIPLQTVAIEKDNVLTSDQLNYVRIDLGKQLPVLPSLDEADQEITVTELANGGPDAMAATASIEKYGQNTTVGYALQSNYENANGDISSITYYAMKRDDYEECESSTDPVQKYLKLLKEGTEETVARAQSGVLFAIQLTGVNKGSVPSVKIFVDDTTSENPGNWNTYWELQNNRYTAKPKDGVVLVPKNWMPRGYEYVFAYTLESYYGVTNLDTSWTYPYDISTYNTTQSYLGKSYLPRSAGNDFEKEQPSIASYLEETGEWIRDKNHSLWKYYVYDPDGALELQGDTYQLFASDEDNYKTYAANQMRNENDAVQQLSVSPSAREKLSESSESGKITAKQLFGAANQNWNPEDIYVFTVDVSDGDNMSLAGNAKSIWMKMKLFEGVYSEKSGSQKFRDWCQSSVGAYDYYFLKTGTQTVKFTTDSQIEGAGTDENRLSYQLIPSGTTEVVNVYVSGDQSVIASIAALRYEIHKKNDDGKVGNLLQTGTVNFANGSASIEMTYVTPGKSVYVQVFPVYDTGQALSDPTTGNHFRDTMIHVPTRKSSGKLSTGHYYAVQQLGAVGESRYANSLTLGTMIAQTQKKQFAFTSDGASNSIWKVSSSLNSIGTNEAGVKYQNVSLQLKQGSVYADLEELQLGYGLTGAYNARENSKPFVYKVLKETAAKNLAAYDSATTGNGVTIHEENGQKYFSLYASDRVPTITSRNFTNIGLTDMTLNFTISEATYKMLETSAGKYDGNIYVEVLESKEAGCTEVYKSETADSYFENVTAEGKAEGETGWSDGGARLFASTQVQRNSHGVYFQIDANDEGNGLTQTTDVTSGDHTYRLNLRNLTPGRKYYIAFYSYNTVTNQLEQYIDGSIIKVENKGENDTYYNADGTKINNPPFRINRTTQDSITTGYTGLPGASALKAAYSIPDYNKNQLEVKFSVNKVSGIDYRYQVKDAAGTNVLVDNDTLMKAMGYEKKTNKVSYWNYETKAWELATDTTWYKKDDDGNLTTPLSLSENATVDFEWSDTEAAAQNSQFANLTSGKEYQLVLTAYYANPLLEVQSQETCDGISGRNNQIPLKRRTNEGNTFTVSGDTASFSVPAKADPTMIGTRASVSSETQSDGSKKLTATVNLTVNDLSKRLGFNRGEGEDKGVIYGFYGLRVKYTDQNGAGETYLNDMNEFTKGGQGLAEEEYYTIGGKNYLYLQADTRYTLKFPVKEGQQYILEVYGINLNDTSNTGNANEMIVDSTSISTLHQNLNIANIDAPRAEDSATSLDTDTGTLSVILYNAANLDKINTARMTITIYHTDADGNVTEHIESYESVVGFKPLKDAGGRTRHQMTVSLKDVLEQFAQQDDALSISVYLYNNATLCLDNIARYNLDSYTKPKQ